MSTTEPTAGRPAALTAMLENAGWHLYALDVANHFSHWLQLSEAQFRQASFLDQRLLSEGAGTPALEPVAVPLAHLPGLTFGQPERLAHFIFHIGHCGSTLISRALAASSSVLPLREPLSLRQLADSQNLLPDDQWKPLLDLVLAAHSRVFQEGQISLIKATSTCNSLILPMMKLSPRSKSLLLYLPLESYLATMLGKQSPALDLRGHAAVRQQEWLRLTGQPSPLTGISDPPFDESGGVKPSINELSEVNLAVLSWLTCMARLLQAHEQLLQRCLLLDFEDFLADPATGLEKLIDFFGLETSRSDILQAWPDISLGYSKQPDQPYSAFNRSRTLARGRAQRAADIQAGMALARQLIAEYPQFQSCEGFLHSN